MERCLIVFPSTRSPEDRCPRCHRRAGDHPAPSDLLADPEMGVHDRPTYYEVLAASARSDAIAALNKMIGHIEYEGEQSRYVSGEPTIETLALRRYSPVASLMMRPEMLPVPAT